jgi:hypothetical protein
MSRTHSPVPVDGERANALFREVPEEDEEEDEIEDDDDNDEQEEREGYSE